MLISNLKNNIEKNPSNKNRCIANICAALSPHKIILKS